MPQTTMTPTSVPGRTRRRPKKATKPRRARATLKTTAAAIEARTGGPPAQAAQDARRLLAIFDGKGRIEDEPLDKETRAFLYRLHAAGVIRNHTVERRNDAGRQWLYFHWLIEPDHLARIASTDRTPRGPAAHQHERHPAAPPASVA